ncbi:GFA family protein [Frateuria sp. GZRR35]|uniref:GFA family protein n=1 Tax=unclassified Frateuria TaxID=2648894 RepID=UPI003EDB6CFB
MRYHGSCHCGRIAFDVEGELDQVIDCNCSHCSRKGYLLWFVPRERLDLATPEADMATYTFNKHAIAHRFCPDCGCAPLAFGSMPDGTPTAAINVRCLEDLDVAAVKRVPVDGRSF